MNQKVSIITATFNDSLFLKECVDSVLNQDYTEWQWILVNNGSTDSTKDLLDGLNDDRITCIHLPKNLGVSGGRNAALEHATGDFICFLDGDDVLPRQSLSARLSQFTFDEVEFVDGAVLSFEGHTNNILSQYTPSFEGDPIVELVSLTGRVFKGNTWMIRRIDGKSYEFDTDCNHGEELLLFTSLANGGKYLFTNEPVLYYRQHPKSAMNNLEALELGYRKVGNELRGMSNVSDELHSIYMQRARLIMFKSYMKTGKVIAAAKSWISFSKA